MAFWAVNPHYWLMSSFSSRRTPTPLQGCFWTSTPTHISECLDPGAGPCTWTCWSSWVSHGPTFQICSGPPESHPSVVSTAPLGFMSCANLSRMHSIPLSVSVMEMLKSTRLKTDPWGTPLITSLCLDIGEAHWCSCLPLLKMGVMFPWKAWCLLSISYMFPL